MADKNVNSVKKNSKLSENMYNYMVYYTQPSFTVREIVYHLLTDNVLKVILTSKSYFNYLCTINTSQLSIYSEEEIIHIITTNYRFVGISFPILITLIKMDKFQEKELTIHFAGRFFNMRTYYDELRDGLRRMKKLNCVPCMSQSFNNKYITQILLELDFAYFVEDQSPSIYNHGLKTVNQQKETKDNIIHSLIYKTKEKEHFDTMYRGDVQPWTRRKIMLKNGYFADLLKIPCLHLYLDGYSITTMRDYLPLPPMPELLSFYAGIHYLAIPKVAIGTYYTPIINKFKQSAPKACLNITANIMISSKIYELTTETILKALDLQSEYKRVFEDSNKHELVLRIRVFLPDSEKIKYTKAFADLISVYNAGHFKVMEENWIFQNEDDESFFDSFRYKVSFYFNNNVIERLGKKDIDIVEHLDPLP